MKIGLSRLMSLGVSLIISMTVIGCINTTPPVSYYALTPMTTSELLSDSPPRLSKISIGIGPITFPRTLQRPQIVTRPSPNRLDLSEFHRWGGDLQQDFLNILLQNISIITGSKQVFKYPGSGTSEPTYRVMLDVHQFDGQLGNAVYLNVYWKIKKEPEEIKNADIKNTVIHLPVTGDDYNALVEAQSKTLKRLSFEIVDAIRQKNK